MGDKEEKFTPHNWKKIPNEKLKNMNPCQKSKYFAYEPPSKQIAEIQAAAKKRLVDLKKANRLRNAPPTHEELVEKDQHAKLIGQLKAAEARNRIRIMRLRYQANRAQEINHLIACQPSALRAVRLQALVPARVDMPDEDDTLDKLARDTIENLLGDESGLVTKRIN